MKRPIKYLSASLGNIFGTVCILLTLFGSFDLQGQNLFVADENGDLYEFTTNGTQTTFATGLSSPMGLAFDSAGNLFVAEFGSGTISKFASDGTRSTFASGLSYPSALAIDSAGNLFEADSGSGNIYEFTPSGVRTTFASGFNNPNGLAFDDAGDLFVLDRGYGEGEITEFSPYLNNGFYDWQQTTFAYLSSDTLNYEYAGLAFNSENNLFLACGGNIPGSHAGTGNIFQFTTNGTQTVFASDLAPEGVAFDGKGNLFEADYDNIYEFATNGTRTTFATVYAPAGLAFKPAPLPQQNLFVEANQSGNIYEFTTNGQESLFASGPSFPGGMTFNDNGDLFVACNTSNTIYEFTRDGTQVTFASGLGSPGPLVFNRAGELFEADWDHYSIYEFAPDGPRRTFATGLQAEALAFDKAGNLFAAAWNASANSSDIYKFVPNGEWSTFATGLQNPVGMAFNSAGDLFVGDVGTDSIYEFTPQGVRSTFLSGLLYPDALAFNDAGNLFVDNGGDIYEFTPSGAPSTFGVISNSSAYVLAFQPAASLPATPMTVTKIAAGDRFSLFLMSDGSLWDMGYDYYGELGDGVNVVDTSGPGRTVANNVTDIAAGGDFSLFLMSDGSLWAMGLDDSGQLGDGTNDVGTSFPEEIVASNVTAIAAGNTHSLFLKSDGSLWAMGDDSYGELGDGTYEPGTYNTNLPEEIVASNVTAIAAGGDYGHGDFSLFLKSDGSLWGMGNNDSGELGDGTDYSTNLPVEIVSSNVAAISAGGGHSLFLKSDGSLWSMGDNSSGQLGDGGFNSTNSPQEIVAGNVTAISAGASHSLFLKGDGSLWAMGSDYYGELGDGTTHYTGGVNIPEEILAGTVTAISAGNGFSLFRRSDGSLWAMGNDTYNQLGDIVGYVGSGDKDTPEQIFPPGFLEQITATPKIGTTPLSVQFDASNVWFFAATSNFMWNFGDGSTAEMTSPTTTHVYSTNGTFFPSLIETNYNYSGWLFGSVVGNVGGFGPAITVVAPSSNDNFSNSIPLVGAASGENFNATLEPDEPNPGGGTVSVTNTVWWSWTAPTNGLASVLTYGSSFDTIIDIYTGNSFSNLTIVASNINTVIDYDVDTNPVEAGLLGRVNFNATAGTTYQIQVSGLSDGIIHIAAETIALRVLTVNQQQPNDDNSINFDANVEVANSGAVASHPLRLRILARAGYSAQNGELYESLPADQVLGTYYLTNPPALTPGTITSIFVSGVCPAPILVDPVSLGFGWGVFAILQQEVGTNWFFTDDDLLFYDNDVWPGPSGGPGGGVIRINPSVSGSTPYFLSAVINGPTNVIQNSTTDYYGTATFSDGVKDYLASFTNTTWSASQFSITTNGVFEAGSVTTNTPVTLTAYYAYDYYGYHIATNQLSVLVVPSPMPSLSGYGFLRNGNFTFTLNALPSSQYVIETTTNLSNPNWLTLATNMTDANGVWVFTDTNSASQGQRFYRAIQMQ